MNYIKYPDRLGKVTLPDNKIWLNALKEFNACQADEHSDKAAFKTACNGRYPDPAWKQGGLAAKIQILNDALAQLGYKEKLIWSPNKAGNEYGYNRREAALNRAKFLNGLDKNKYPAATLPKG